MNDWNDLSPKQKTKLIKSYNQDQLEKALDIFKKGLPYPPGHFSYAIYLITFGEFEKYEQYLSELSDSQLEWEIKIPGSGGGPTPDQDYYGVYY